MKYIITAILGVSAVLAIWFMKYDPAVLGFIDSIYKYVGNNVAAVIFHKSVTVAELQNKYDAPSKKIRILVMPGHEPNYGGAEYKDLKERDMNVDLANDLADFLRNNPHYEVIVPRDKNAWSPTFDTYFKTNWDDIISFFKDSKDEELRLISAGKLTPVVATVFHNKAPQDVAYRLYGINKWEGENNIDIAIHIHFNDYRGRPATREGKYSGFAIYVPERQYANSTTTRAIATTVFARLAKYNAVSNFPEENNGVIEEPDLIAIGAHNTTNSASMLIEYGYIYQPEFADPDVRAKTLKDLAFQTYLGLQDFFGSGKDVAYAYDTLMLPHLWKGDVGDKVSSEDALALQSALLIDGEYPPEGKDKNDCPRTGSIGTCTKAALQAFQKKYGIKGEDGVLGEKTQKALNEKYSAKSI